MLLFPSKPGLHLKRFDLHIPLIFDLIMIVYVAFFTFRVEDMKTEKN